MRMEETKAGVIARICDEEIEVEVRNARRLLDRITEAFPVLSDKRTEVRVIADLLAEIEAAY